jgi:hypothetical protein
MIMKIKKNIVGYKRKIKYYFPKTRKIMNILNLRLYINRLCCCFYRNGVDTEEEIYRVTYYGKGRMPVSFLLLFTYLAESTP